MHSRYRAPTRQRRGTAAVEFTMWLLPTMVLLAVIIDGAFYVSDTHNLARITRDGARVGAATLEPFGGGGVLIEAAAKSHTETAAGFAGYGNPTVEADYHVDGSNHAWITVNITIDYSSVFSGLSPFGPTLEYGFTMMTLEQP